MTSIRWPDAVDLPTTEVDACAPPGSGTPSQTSSSQPRLSDDASDDPTAGSNHLAFIVQYHLLRETQASPSGSVADAGANGIGLIFLRELDGFVASVLADLPRGYPSEPLSFNVFLLRSFP
jgi:hypothetical protein